MKVAVLCQKWVRSLFIFLEQVITAALAHHLELLNSDLHRSGFMMLQTLKETSEVLVSACQYKIQSFFKLTAVLLSSLVYCILISAQCFHSWLEEKEESSLCHVTQLVHIGSGFVFSFSLNISNLLRVCHLLSRFSTSTEALTFCVVTKRLNIVSMLLFSPLILFVCCIKLLRLSGNLIEKLAWIFKNFNKNMT